MNTFLHKLKPDVFERWFFAAPSDLDETNYNFDQFQRDHQSEAPDRIKQQFVSAIRSAVREQNSRINVHTKGIGIKGYVFELDFSDIFSTHKLKADTKAHLESLMLQNAGQAKITSTIIRTLRVTGATSSVGISDCCIARLILDPNMDTDISIHGSWIGQLDLVERAINNLEIKGGSVRNLTCPSPDKGSPFSGSVSFSDVKLPTSSSSSRLFKGAQSYRNLRAHLQVLENAPAVNLMRSLELRTERHSEGGFTKFISWMYGTFADYGRQPGRSFACAIVVWFITVLAIFVWDGGTVGMDAEHYTGWRKLLLEDSDWGSARRALLLPIQSIFDPFGLFSTRKLVLASTGWGHILLIVQGVITDAFLAMTIFGVRMECAPEGGQVARLELTGNAGLSEDGSHGQAPNLQY